jgi:hypothetical protein
MEELTVFRSPDKRHKTSTYFVEGKANICIAEPTKKGVLVTQLSEQGEVIDQVYSVGGDVAPTLAAYLGPSVKAKFVEVPRYEGLALRAKCASCNGRIVRELDSKRPEEIEEVPVIPIFCCVSCQKRFYNISNSYLRKLVELNPDMFEKEDLVEKEKDGDAFINTLNEYIVRVFASKKISKLIIEK